MQRIPRPNGTRVVTPMPKRIIQSTLFATIHRVRNRFPIARGALTLGLLDHGANIDIYADQRACAIAIHPGGVANEAARY